jgi:fumarylacetoacetate (FAA) hydrolase
VKLVSYLKNWQEQAAILVHDRLYDLNSLHPRLPSKMQQFLDGWHYLYEFAHHANEVLQEAFENPVPGERYDENNLLAPLPHPPSCRDGYAFRQHVEAARLNRGVEMIPQFDQYPIFYFTNHKTIQGPGEIHCMPDHFEQLDFELEVAVIIGKAGINIKAEEADEYIAGLTIMNDMSARTLQMEEMVLNLGPAKGKDFSTVIGPWLVTLDELKPYETKPKPGHTGKSWNLPMRCSVNSIIVSEANLGDMDWTFAEIIERASYGVPLYPGDVIGSGTCGTGCFLELNGTNKRNNPNYKPQWLKEGDHIEMEVEKLGKLVNRTTAHKSDHSILKLKK